MTVGFINVPLASTDFSPAGVPLDQEHAYSVSSVRPMGPFKSTYLAKNETLVAGSEVCSCQNTLSSVSLLASWSQAVGFPYNLPCEDRCRFYHGFELRCHRSVSLLYL